MPLKLKLKLNEAKSIDDIYSKEFNSIDRDTFDSIIALDPETDLAKNKIGQVAKAFLLPKYVAGETEFLDLEDEVKEATGKFETQRSSLPQSLRNINNFPTVKDFVEYMLMGEESDFGKSFNPETVVATKKENKIDNIYNTYYSDIDRATFDKIIALDPETTENSVGELARNLLLPAYQKGEKKYIDDEKELEALRYVISKFTSDKSNYAKDKQAGANYKSIWEFINTRPESESTTEAKRAGFIEGKDFIILASTRNYDVIRPLTFEASKKFAHTRNMSNVWCTAGGSTGTNYSNTYFNNYTWNKEMTLYEFLEKNTTDRNVQWNLALNKNSIVYEFRDGSNDGDFNDRAAKLFATLLKKNLDMALELAQTNDPIAKNPQVIQAAELARTVITGKPIELDGEASLKDWIEDPENKYDMIKDFTKKISVKNVTKIPGQAFANMTNLEEVELDDNITYLGVQCFFNDTKLKKIKLPANITQIGAECFRFCDSLTGNVRLPNSLTTLGRMAFANTGKNLTLGIDTDRAAGTIAADPADRDWFITHVKRTNFNG